MHSQPYYKFQYLVAARTGYRRSELRKMRWSDLELDGKRPFIKLPEYCVKNSEENTIPLLPGAIEAFRELRKLCPKNSEKVFWGGIAKVETLQKHLTEAGVTVLTDNGKRRYLHSLRMSFDTFLIANNVPVKLAQRMMRHKDIRLTLQLYADVDLLNYADELSNLPRTTLTK